MLFINNVVVRELMRNAATVLSFVIGVCLNRVMIMIYKLLMKDSKDVLYAGSVVDITLAHEI